MAFVDQEKCREIASLIHAKKFRHAISMIHKEQLQSNIAGIMNHYKKSWEYSDDSIYDFLLEYIEHGQFSYKIDKPKQYEGHVLTDIQKELDKNTYPRRNEFSDRIMHQFVQRLLKPGRKKIANDLELFSFRTINHLIEQLQKEVIQVTNPDMFNDPFDCLILSGIRRHKEMLKTENRNSVNTYVKEMSRIRVCCFAGWDKKKEKPPYLNTLMWSHYARNHEGICIKYSISANEPILGQGVSDSHSSCILEQLFTTAAPCVLQILWRPRTSVILEGKHILWVSVIQFLNEGFFFSVVIQHLCAVGHQQIAILIAFDEVRIDIHENLCPFGKDNRCLYLGG